MADLYQLPDGRMIRRGTAFSLTEIRKRVVPAVIGTDEATGDQFIAEPAKLVDAEQGRQFPANWLQIASKDMLDLFGIKPLTEQPDPDTRFFMVSPGGIVNGVLTKHVLPRPIDQLRRWLIDDTRRQATDLIQLHYPLADQVNDQQFQIELVNVAVPDTADDKELRKIKKRQGWMRDVKAYMRDLIADIEALTTAEDAKVWHSTPAEWPVWPETKAGGGVVAPEVVAVG